MVAQQGIYLWKCGNREKKITFIKQNDLGEKTDDRSAVGRINLLFKNSLRSYNGIENAREGQKNRAEHTNQNRLRLTTVSADAANQ